MLTGIGLFQVLLPAKRCYAHSGDKSHSEWAEWRRRRKKGAEQVIWQTKVARDPRATPVELLNC